MYIIILSKIKTKKNSCNLLLLSTEKKVKKKIGVVGYNKRLNKFVLTIKLFYICELFRNGINFDEDFYKELLKLINSFCL